MKGKPAALTRAAFRKFPLPIADSGDKNERGRILVIAGCREVPGAALLCALAAMRAGAGKLKIVTVERAAEALGVAMPEARIIAVPEGRDGGFARSAVKTICRWAAGMDAVVAGPGIAPGKANALLAAGLCDAGSALVLDAALLAALPDKADEVRGADEPPILLPHSGEMAALLDWDEGDVKADPLAAGRACAERYGAFTLVKGKRSHVVAPDGRAWLYSGGSPGLSVSGSGDVLAGIVGGLRARGADALTALLWGVWLHGEAGAALGRRIGNSGFLARELPAEVPALMRS